MSEHSYGLYEPLRVIIAYMGQPLQTYRPFYAYPKNKIGVERPLGYVYKNLNIQDKTGINQPGTRL